MVKYITRMARMMSALWKSSKHFTHTLPEHPAKTSAEFTTIGEPEHPVLCAPEFVTDHELPVELQTYLDTHLRQIAKYDSSFVDDIAPQRLIPPTMNERIVRARLQFTGEDAPRIWIDDEMDY